MSQPKLHLMVMQRMAEVALEPLKERFQRAVSAPYRLGLAAPGATGVFDLLVYGPDFEGTQAVARATVDPFSGEVVTEYLGDAVRLIARPEVFPDEVTEWVEQFIDSVESPASIRLEGAEGFEVVITVGCDGQEYGHMISDDVRARALITRLKALSAGAA